VVRIFATFDWSARPEGSPPGRALLSASSLGTPSDHEIRGARYLSRDGSWTVVADATLHNKQALGQELGLDADVQTGELLARGFERWGQALPEQLIGDFSFVIWDERAGRVFAARDPWGVRGLVYWDAWPSLHLATDVEQLPMSRARAPDEQTLVEFLTWDYRSSGRTFFRGISRVPAGHFLFGDAAGIRVNRYWWPPAQDIVLPTTEDYHREFRRLFFQSVGDRLGGSRPILCHLSGGIDSSSIVCAADALVRRQHTPAIKAVSARYPNLDCDESPFIDAVSRNVRIPVESWDGTIPVWADLEDALLDWPGGRTLHAGGTSGALDIARRDGAGALLGGSGGDQIGSSTGVLPDLVDAAQWGAVLATLFTGRGNLVQSVRRFLALATGALPAKFDPLKRGLRSLRAPTARDATFPWLSPRLQALAAERATTVDREQWTFTSHLQRHRWSELTSPTLGWSIERQRRAASLAQVEMRFPFLDVRLANFVLAVPYERWPPGPYPQRIHRTVLRDLLPPEILARTRKTTFQSALSGQVQAGLGRIRRLLSSGTWAAEPYVDRRHALRLLVQCEQRLGSFWEHRLLWNIATIEAWLRRVFG
jgi:asparagine synthase (glutamine-hydrolysing)